MKTNPPWYRTTVRWGQTNLTEIDPIKFDLEFWRKQWRDTHIQGVIVNAGGIVAYYPSQIPLQHQADHLLNRDLFGEICTAAREEGLVVLARMDSNRCYETLFQAHPDWIAKNHKGQPYRAGGLFVTCIHSPYYGEFIPSILHEIIQRYEPDGFTDNSWSGLSRDQICYCGYCQESFSKAYSEALPQAVDWDDPIYRRWIRWNYDRRLEMWDTFNHLTRKFGGLNCLWVGMNSGNLLWQSRSFRDLKAICERSEIILLDHQTRDLDTSFQGNSHIGKLIHELLGWDRLIPESMAMYQSPQPTFRVAARPEAEARLWMVEGFAGGIQPWWHHIGAHHEDRRQFQTAPPLLSWHAENQDYLVDREPVASVGIVWSQENIDFFGRDQAEARAVLPYIGFLQALIRARIPYIPVHADHIERVSEMLKVLILPNMGCLSETQCQAVRQFVEKGGGLVSTGETSLFDEFGNRRNDFRLRDLFGVTDTGEALGAYNPQKGSWEDYDQHTYLRIHSTTALPIPSMNVNDRTAGRHPMFAGFEETDIIAFGGRLHIVEPGSRAQVPLTYVPPFPIYPPEFAWMREKDSLLPALVLNEFNHGSRSAYLPASIDLSYGRYGLPDHGQLLANLVRWAARDRIPLQINGPGLIDCHLYRKSGNLILHMVNLNSAGIWKGPVQELVPAGPYTISVQINKPASHRSVKSLVTGKNYQVQRAEDWSTFEIETITDHEVLVIQD